MPERGMGLYEEHFTHLTISIIPRAVRKYGSARNAMSLPGMRRQVSDEGCTQWVRFNDCNICHGSTD